MTIWLILLSIVIVILVFRDAAQNRRIDDLEDFIAEDIPELSVIKVMQLKEKREEHEQDNKET